MAQRPRVHISLGTGVRGSAVARVFWLLDIHIICKLVTEYITFIAQATASVVLLVTSNSPLVQYQKWGPQLRGKAVILVIILTSGIDFILVGYDQGLFGGVLAGERFQDMLGNPGPTMSGLVTAIYDIGCALDAVAAFIWGEKIGRKNSIIAANLVVVGAAIQTASYSYWQMFASRIICGIGVGLSTVAVPIL